MKPGGLNQISLLTVLPLSCISKKTSPGFPITSKHTGTLSAPKLTMKCGSLSTENTKKYNNNCYWLHYNL